MHTYTYNTNSKTLHASHEKEVLPLFPTEIISSPKDEEEALDREENNSIASQHKTTGSPLDHSHASKNNRKSKGRNNNPSGEEICQFPTGTASRVRVIGDPFGNEVGDGGDDVENQDEQGPVNAIVLQGTSQHKKGQPNCPTEGECHKSCGKHNFLLKVLVRSHLGVKDVMGTERSDGSMAL